MIAELAPQYTQRSRFAGGTSTASRAPSRERTSTRIVSTQTAPDRRGFIVIHGDSFQTGSLGASYVGMSERKEITGHPVASVEDKLRESRWPNELAAFLPRIYFLERNNRQRAASKFIMRIIEMKFHESDLVTVNSLIENIELERLSVYSVSGLLRCSARGRNHLPAWKGAYYKAKDVLLSRGEDAEGILAGLTE